MFKLAIILIFVGLALSQPGSYRPLDLDDAQVKLKLKDIANFGLNRISEIRASRESNKTAGIKANLTSYSLVAILSAKGQVVAGMNYDIKLRMKEASCKNSCKIEECSMIVYEMPWNDYIELSKYECKVLPSDVKIGEIKDINLDEQAKSALNFTIFSMNERLNVDYIYTLVKVKKATRQVVQGFLYTFDYSLGRSNCTKSGSFKTPQKVCTIVDGTKPFDCKASVWDQSWLNETRYKILNTSC